VSMDKLQLKTWIDEQVDSLGISVFAEQIGLSRQAVRNLQAAKVDSLRHETLKSIAACRNQSIREVKDWLQILDQVPVQGSDTDRLAALEEKYEQLQGDYELLQAEVSELKTLIKVLIEGQNGEKRTRTSKNKV
jgi:DNA-binding Xre family transcriptional regulator